MTREILKLKIRSSEVLAAKIRSEKISITDLAKKSGISRQSIHNLLNGKGVPDTNTINRLNDAVENSQ